MINIDVKISIKKLSDYSEDLRGEIDEKTLLLMIKSFTEYISFLYGSLIEQEAQTSRYKRGWEPKEEESYIEYIGTHPVDNIMDLIKDSLEVVKIGNNFIVRVSPKYKYPGSDLTLMRVLRAIEDGTSDFSARPILKKCNRYITSSILDLWRNYLMIKGVV